MADLVQGAKTSIRRFYEGVTTPQAGVTPGPTPSVAKSLGRASFDALEGGIMGLGLGLLSAKLQNGLDVTTKSGHRIPMDGLAALAGVAGAAYFGRKGDAASRVAAITASNLAVAGSVTYGFRHGESYGAAGMNTTQQVLAHKHAALTAAQAKVHGDGLDGGESSLGAEDPLLEFGRVEFNTAA